MFLKFPFIGKAQGLVNVNCFGVFFVDKEKYFMEVKDVECVVNGQAGCLFGVAKSLMCGGYDDEKFAVTMDLVDAEEFYKADGFFLFIGNDEAALVLVMNVLVVDFSEFINGDKWLFKPVAHDGGIVVERMDEFEVISF